MPVPSRMVLSQEGGKDENKKGKKGKWKNTIQMANQNLNTLSTSLLIK